MDGGWEEASPGVTALHPLSRSIGRLLHHQESSDFFAIRRLETTYPELSFRITGSSSTGFVLRHQDEETAFLLARLAREASFGISLCELEVETRGIFLQYHLGFPSNPSWATRVSPSQGVLTARVTTLENRRIRLR